ncbi:hypothetical protein TNCV_2901701 [Trichonephila clavipes]|nr:hypothetical protein TNCV_2901701 [Trichonephila clavipes]
MAEDGDWLNNLLWTDEAHSRSEGLSTPTTAEFGLLKILELSWKLHCTTRKSRYTRAFGDGPRNFEPWSSDVDDT